MARGSHWCLVRISTFVAIVLSRASQFWEVGRALIQVGQRDCVLLTDWPVKLGLQSWTLIIWEGQREQGLGLTHKLVHIALASHLWTKGCQARHTHPALVGDLEDPALLMGPPEHQDPMTSLTGPWSPLPVLFTHLYLCMLRDHSVLFRNFTGESWDLHFLFLQIC